MCFIFIPLELCWPMSLLTMDKNHIWIVYLYLCIVLYGWKVAYPFMNAKDNVMLNQWSMPINVGSNLWHWHQCQAINLYWDTILINAGNLIWHWLALIIDSVQSFREETQHFRSYLSFGKECIPVNLELYIISTMLMVKTCQKPHCKIDHGCLTILKCLSTSYIGEIVKLNSSRN